MGKKRNKTSASSTEVEAEAVQQQHHHDRASPSTSTFKRQLTEKRSSGSSSSSSTNDIDDIFHQSRIVAEALKKNKRDIDIVNGDTDKHAKRQKLNTGGKDINKTKTKTQTNNTQRNNHAKDKDKDEDNDTSAGVTSYITPNASDDDDDGEEVSVGEYASDDDLHAIAEKVRIAKLHRKQKQHQHASSSHKSKSSSVNDMALRAAPADDMGFTRSASAISSKYQYTDDGYRIYTEDELNIGIGGDTADCPFDCQCCF